ncbi:HAMP domain protein [Neomoorella glycerini]|uniref:HAMP domain protein n=1 Tax=Neomoorella glycerini TaxID=55779 RepID=A0A6I5ZW49_9FIRM|nr:methyl-accepting chemotaxis protein [Moorella glycerini]QGP93808.1 HAMP domain protein [Moorella glycerini]
MFKGINLAIGSRRISVINKITLALGLLLLFIIPVVGSSFFLREQALIRREYQGKGQEIARTVALFAAEYILSGNLDFLTGIVHKLNSYGNIDYVVVTDTSGRVLAASTNNFPAGGKTAGVDTAAAANEFTAPITPFGGETIGYVRLGLNPAQLKNSTLAMAVDWALFALAAVLAGIFLAAILTKRILQKPLAELTAAAELVSAGDFSSRANVLGGDELGDLANSFNTMSFHLANLIQSVKISIADVQKGMEQLHSSLQTAGRTNSRFLRNLAYLKENAEEQLKALALSASLAEQLVNRFQQTSERQNASFTLTNNALGAAEKGATAVRTATSKLNDFYHELAESQKLQALLLEKGELWSAGIANLAALSEHLAPFVVEVALEAAKSGNEGLTTAAENLSQALRDTYTYLKDLRLELIALMDACRANREALEKSLLQVGALQDNLAASTTTWVELRQILQGKKEVELEIREELEWLATTSHTLTKDFGDYLPALNKLLQGSLSSDGQLPLADWQEIDSLAKKLLRMIERLKALAWQYKT